MKQDALAVAADRARSFLVGLPERSVTPRATVDELRASLGGPLPEDSLDPALVVEELAEAADAGIVGIAGPRYFGFVIGGALPAALGADWLTSTWEQNAGLYAAGPAASVVEEVAVTWLKDLLGLPEDASAGFVTGGQMANYTGLSAARFHVLSEQGWDVNERGLFDAPCVRVVTSAERHVTIDRALRFLGFGTAMIETVATDDQGRLVPDDLGRVLEGGEGPAIVCMQAGNVNTGSFDPFVEAIPIAHEHGAWVHIDGAFGLWAAASSRYEHLMAGAAEADSWATDAHKTLNVPYDSGLVFVRHTAAHRAAMSVQASYLIQSDGALRDEMDWVPEFSRRARGFSVYAALRQLGRNGVGDLVDGLCEGAARFAERLDAASDVEVLNDVIFNQVLVRFTASDGDHDERTRRVVAAVQEDGTCWLSGSRWRDLGVMRISVSNHSTTSEDVDRSVEAILKAAASV